MDLKTARWNLLWAVQRSVRYLARREGWFDRWRLRAPTSLSLSDLGAPKGRVSSRENRWAQSTRN